MVGNDNGIIIQINIALSQLDDDVLLVLFLQVRYNGTLIDTVPVQFDPISQFGIVPLNEDVNYTVVKFMLRDISAVVPIRTPSDQELYTLLM